MQKKTGITLSRVLLWQVCLWSREEAIASNNNVNKILEIIAVPETNIAPENGWLGDSKANFEGQCSF